MTPLPLPQSLYGRTLGRSYGHVITKFSRPDGLPKFLTHGAPLARFARWSSAKNCLHLAEVLSPVGSGNCNIEIDIAWSAVKPLCFRSVVEQGCPLGLQKRLLDYPFLQLQKFFKTSAPADCSSCRLCRAIGDRKWSKNLFSPANRPLLDAAQGIFGQTLVQDNNFLPHLLCRPCERRLKNFIAFKILITES